LTIVWSREQQQEPQITQISQMGPEAASAVFSFCCLVGLRAWISRLAIQSAQSAKSAVLAVESFLVLALLGTPTSAA
jgi:hypothetical protein